MLLILSYYVLKLYLSASFLMRSVYNGICHNIVTSPDRILHSIDIEASSNASMLSRSLPSAALRIAMRCTVRAAGCAALRCSMRTARCAALRCSMRTARCAGMRASRGFAVSGLYLRAVQARRCSCLSMSCLVFRAS